MPELSIRKIIEKTLSGEIRIPSFQRGFVWEPEKVAFFIDSLYKGYPIGSLLFWRTNIRLENERQLGNYSLPEPTKGYPLDYVLDGQQRICGVKENSVLILLIRLLASAFLKKSRSQLMNGSFGICKELFCGSVRLQKRD